MERVSLVLMTRELCHEFYRGLENDPMIYTNMSEFSQYIYNEEKVDNYYNKQLSSDRIVFAVMLGDEPVGMVKLKNINREKKECSLGIALKNDSFKGKGYGSEAERQALDYAFDRLKMTAVNADAVLKNRRSQHVLEKVGFRYVCQDKMFKYYRFSR